MRRWFFALASVLVALAALPALGQAQPASGVRGTLLDETCGVGCAPECPPPPSCRVLTPCPQAGADASIVCPLLRQAPPVCTTAAAGCPPPPLETPDFPPYAGTAGSVIVRRTGTAKVLGRVPVEAGRFTAHLAPGRYVLRAHVAEPCWTGNRQVVEIEADRWIPLVLRVADACAAQPSAG